MREMRPSLVETSLEIELQDPRVVAELIAAIPVGIALVHPFDLRIMAANPAMASALEVVPEALLGGRVVQVLPENHPLADPTHYREVTATARHLEGRLQHRDRTWRWFLRPLRGSGLVYVLAGLDEIRAAPRDEPVDLAGLLVELVAEAQRRYPDLAIEIELNVPEASAR